MQGTDCDDVAFLFAIQANHNILEPLCVDLQKSFNSWILCINKVWLFTPRISLPHLSAVFTIQLQSPHDPSRPQSSAMPQMVTILVILGLCQYKAISPPLQHCGTIWYAPQQCGSYTGLFTNCSACQHGWNGHMRPSPVYKHLAVSWAQVSRTNHMKEVWRAKNHNLTKLITKYWSEKQINKAM